MEYFLNLALIPSHKAVFNPKNMAYMAHMAYMAYLAYMTDMAYLADEPLTINMLM